MVILVLCVDEGKMGVFKNSCKESFVASQKLLYFSQYAPTKAYSQSARSAGKH